MSARTVTLIILLVLSEGMGVAIGEVFFRLYVSAIPPVGQSAFNVNASHVAHVTYGAGVGAVLFLWSLLGMGAGGIMSKFGKKEEPKA